MDFHDWDVDQVSGIDQHIIDFQAGWVWVTCWRVELHHRIRVGAVEGIGLIAAYTAIEELDIGVITTVHKTMG